MIDNDALEPVPVDAYGGLISILDGADVPLGCSPDCRDVQFFPGNVRTRAGLDPLHTLAAGSDVPYLTTFITPDLESRLLMWDSTGKMYRETTPGAKITISTTFAPNSIYDSVTQFGREWIVESDGTRGVSLPTVFDDQDDLFVLGNAAPTKNPTGQDLGVVEANPTQAPVAALVAIIGNLSAGNYSYKTVLVTGDGTTNVTLASPASNVVVAVPATNGQVDLTLVATGTPGVVAKRRIYRTLAGGVVYYYIAYIEGNEETTYRDNVPDASIDLTKVEPAVNNTAGGQLVAGERQVVAWFESEAGAFSAPSPAGGWKAMGGFKVRVTGIPVWPGTAGERPVVKRRLAFTGPDDVVFRHIASKMTIDDNTTTTLDLDFNEAELQAGEDITRLFRQQIPAGSSDFQGQLGIGAYATRLCLWGGNPLFGEPFRASLVRWSDPEDPEFWDNVDGLMNVAENDGGGIKAGFGYKNRFYFVKDNSMHSTQDDGINPPRKWQVDEESPKIGTPSVHGTGIGEDWVVIAHRSGLYYFAGGEPIKISQEIQPTWDSINWLYGYKIWVRVDTDKKRIYVGGPFCTATKVNLILCMDYQEGILVDPISNAGKGRKWSPWFIAGAHGNFIRRANLDDRFLVGMSDASGLVQELRNSKLSDNGVAINSYYRTTYVSRAEAGRQMFGQFTCLARGDGSLQFTTIRQGGGSASWLAMTLSSPATQDLEKTIDVQSERVSMKVGTNAIDKWFSVAKLTIWTMEHPFAKHRGNSA